FLVSRGTRVVCSWGTKPLSPPRWMAALDGAGFLVPPDRFPPEPSVMVALDTASPDRLGTLQANAGRARDVIVIDHHRTNPGFGSIVVLDPAASSTAELVFRLVERMGGDIPDAAAASLYAGMVTDTGRFQVSLRSRGSTDVGAIAQAFGGGGHQLAAGYTSQTGVEETARLLIEAIGHSGVAGPGS